MADRPGFTRYRGGRKHVEHTCQLHTGREQSRVLRISWIFRYFFLLRLRYVHIRFPSPLLGCRNHINHAAFANAQLMRLLWANSYRGVWTISVVKRISLDERRWKFSIFVPLRNILSLRNILPSLEKAAAERVCTISAISSLEQHTVVVFSTPRQPMAKLRRHAAPKSSAF